MSETVKYRYDGDQPEMFPDNPVHAVLEPGDEFDGPAGVVHPRLSVADGSGWKPTLSEEASQPPHDPYDFLADAPQGPQPAQEAPVDASPPVTQGSPTAPTEVAPAPPTASPNFGSV